MACSVLRREVIEGREKIKSLAILSDQKRDQDSRIAPSTSSSRTEQGATYGQVVQIPASREVRSVEGGDGFTVVNRRKRVKRQAVAGPGYSGQPGAASGQLGEAAHQSGVAPVQASVCGREVAPTAPAETIVQACEQHVKDQVTETFPGKREKPSIKIFRDSMVRNTTKTVKCEAEGSGCVHERGGNQAGEEGSL